MGDFSLHPSFGGDSETLMPIGVVRLYIISVIATNPLKESYYVLLTYSWTYETDDTCTIITAARKDTSTLTSKLTRRTLEVTVVTTSEP